MITKCLSIEPVKVKENNPLVGSGNRVYPVSFAKWVSRPVQSETGREKEDELDKPKAGVPLFDFH